jgi:hypothetical protein
MKNFKFISILGVLLCLWMLSYTSCKEKDPLVVQGNIEGTVTDAETSQAVPSVNVNIVANSNTTFAEQSKQTGSDGKFSFKDIEAGSYKLSFSKNGYEDNSKNINLSAGQTSSGDVTLTPIKPVLSVSTVLLDFGATNNILPIEISNTGKGELNWTIVEDLTWLSVTPATGKTTATPASVTVTIDRSLFTETTKTGTFTINSNGGSATVNVTASKEIPVLQISTNSLDFGISTNFLQLEISNIGKGELNWSIVEDLAWLSVNPVSGTTVSTASVATVTIDRSLFTETNKTGTFVINSNGGNATVNVFVGKTIPVLAISATLLDFGTANNILPLEITNTGTGELNWSIIEELDWLSVNPASGTAISTPASVTATIDRSKFTGSASSITGTITINSNGGNATVNISASWENPVLNVSVTSLDFGTTTNNLSLEITNTGKGELNWSIVEDLTWLSVNPVSGKTTTTTSVVTITVDRTQLSENSKTATFLVNSNGGSVTVNVSISKPTAVLSVTPTTLDFGETETEKSINISNTGAGTLTYTATTAQSWITLENGANSVTTDTKIIKVKVARTGLTSGNYTGDVVINSNVNSVIVPISMKILQPSAPALLNGQASGITYNSAQVSATLTSLGSSAVTQHGHCWSTSPNPTTTDNKTTLGGTGVLKSFTSNITGLSANTTYYVKAYATNAVGTTYSDAITFNTLPPPTMATVQTTRTENVKHNQIDGVGNLTVLGDGLVTDYGFCYSTSNATPTTSDSKASLGQTTQTGNFTVTVTGLQGGAKYYLRAYAVNSMGTAYGGVVEATTADAPPVVTSGLVAYYTFDGENCSEAQGKSEYNGVKQGNGNPVWSTDIPGKSGKSLQLNNDAYFLVPTGPINCFPSTYSYSIWLKTMTVGNTAVNLQTGSIYGTCIYISTNNQVAVYYTSYTYYFDLDVSGLLLDGNWHLLNITRNGNTFKLYIDGVYYANYTYSYTNNNNSPMFIGNGFTGKMDNFRVYNRELTQSEITEIYNAKQ